uniref:Uncharacterized protein n=2 Tax=Aplanochytrium stocchinoi TaxID=215587 RepID=A0A6S8D7M7_9STRA
MDKVFNLSKAAAAAYVMYKLVKLGLTDSDLLTYECALNKVYFRDKIVWITGASSGIGKEIATQLSKLDVGVKLILSARRKKELEKLSEMLECESAVVPVDLFELDSLEAVAESALAAFGRVDILFNNGGISTRALAENTDFSVDEKIMKIDYLSYVKLTKLVLPQMIERRSGHIVNMSSLAGKLGSPMRSAYSGAKFALIGHFDSLRLELARYDIHVTNICPGSVQTEVDKNALTSTGNSFGIEDPGRNNAPIALNLCVYKLSADFNCPSKFYALYIYVSDIRNGMTVSRAADRMLA